MHNDTYASGFLYHLPTDQILLQHNPLITPDSWSLFSVKTSPEYSVKSFADMLKNVLAIDVSHQKIFSVYDYIKKVNTHYSIYYAEIDEMIETNPYTGEALSWFSRRQIAKLPLDLQLKQDVTVSIRVIDSRIRKSLGLHTLE